MRFTFLALISAASALPLFEDLASKLPGFGGSSGTPTLPSLPSGLPALPAGFDPTKLIPPISGGPKLPIKRRQLGDLFKGLPIPALGSGSGTTPSVPTGLPSLGGFKLPATPELPTGTGADAALPTGLPLGDLPKLPSLGGSGSGSGLPELPKLPLPIKN